WPSTSRAFRPGSIASRSWCRGPAESGRARRARSRCESGENSGRELSCARMRLPILVYHKIDRIPPGSRYRKNYVTPEQFAAQLAASDIRDMQETGIEFGSQTATHAHLAALRPVEVLRELRTSREQLGALLGKPVAVLSYPYGEYTQDTLQFARDSGYEAGVTVRERMN